MLLTIFLTIVFCGAMAMMLVSAVAFIQDISPCLIVICINRKARVLDNQGLTTKKGSAYALPKLVERRGFELNWHFRESESR